MTHSLCAQLYTCVSIRVRIFCVCVCVCVTAVITYSSLHFSYAVTVHYNVPSTHTHKLMKTFLNNAHLRTRISQSGNHGCGELQFKDT